MMENLDMPIHLRDRFEDPGIDRDMPVALRVAFHGGGEKDNEAESFCRL